MIVFRGEGVVEEGAMGFWLRRPVDVVSIEKSPDKVQVLKKRCI